MTDNVCEKKTAVLGPEYDDLLRTTLRNVIKRMKGKSISRSWGVGGSQEIETELVQIGTEQIVIESETYIGLSIYGAVKLVDHIKDMVNIEHNPNIIRRTRQRDGRP